MDFDQEITETLSRRLSFLKFFIFLVFLIIFVRLFYLQVIKGDYFFDLSENNRIKVQEIPAPRGVIYDRNGKILANNTSSFDVSLLYSGIKQLKGILPLLSEILNIGPEDIIKKVKNSLCLPRFKPIKLKLDISRKELSEVEFYKLDLPNVVVEFFPKRNYPLKEILAHVLGYLGEINESELTKPEHSSYTPGDFLGKSGIEKIFENHLKGRSGWLQFEVDSLGRKKRVLGSVDPVPGEDLFLTIDSGLQSFADQALREKNGSVIAMNPNTGEILAFVSHPSFDPNLFSRGISFNDWGALIKNPSHPLTNKGIQGLYPPGSLFKIITAIAGLEEGKITPDTKIFCNGFFNFGNRLYRCWKKGGHGTLNLFEATEQSCDVYFYQVGHLVGIDHLAYYAKLFGLGSPTGIILENEKGGLVPTSKWKEKTFHIPWQKGETLSCAVGQGFYLTTPLQMLVVISAIANGGKLYTPSLVKKLEYGAMLKDFTFNDATQLPISLASINTIRESLWRVVQGQNGTAKIARLADIEIAGKTGTAQVVGLPPGKTCIELPAHLQDHAWFFGFAPFNNPQIAVVVLVEHGGFGSVAAAPIARDVIQYYLENKGL